MYEKWHSRPYKHKTLIKIKRCLGCGREILYSNPAQKKCSFCDGDLVDKYVVRKPVDKTVQKNQQKRLKT